MDLKRKKHDGVVQNVRIWFRIGTSGRLSNEHDNEPMKFYEEHKCEEFHNSLSDY